MTAGSSPSATGCLGAGADRDAYDLAYATIDLPAVAATATVLLACPVEELTRRVARRRRDGEKHVSAEGKVDYGTHNKVFVGQDSEDRGYNWGKAAHNRQWKRDNAYACGSWSKEEGAHYYESERW